MIKLFIVHSKGSCFLPVMSVFHLESECSLRLEMLTCFSLQDFSQFCALKKFNCWWYNLIF